MCQWVRYFCKLVLTLSMNWIISKFLFRPGSLAGFSTTPANHTINGLFIIIDYDLYDNLEQLRAELD